MAKDVDLSSKEWTDLIFEGKNKEFGAYTLRANSDKRHNKAMIAVVVAIAVILAIVFGIKALPKPQEDLTTENDQTTFEMAQANIEEEDEEVEVIYEEPEEIHQPDEFLNTIGMSEFEITEGPTEVISQDEAKESDAAVSTETHVSDNNDIENAKIHQEEIVIEEPVKVVEKKEEVFTAVEQMPTYPGGDAALYKAINDNLRYPPMAAENGIQGRVVVQFVVQKDGHVGQVKVVRGKDPDLDKEAVRVVKKLGKFNPGRNNGVPVAVWYTLPINFKLANM